MPLKHTCLERNVSRLGRLEWSRWRGARENEALKAAASSPQRKTKICGEPVQELQCERVQFLKVRWAQRDGVERPRVIPGLEQLIAGPCVCVAADKSHRRQLSYVATSARRRLAHVFYGNKTVLKGRQVEKRDADEIAEGERQHARSAVETRRFSALRTSSSATASASK